MASGLVRIYERAGEQEFRLEIGLPVPDQDDWRCDVRIDGKLRYAMGVDAVQAMWLALCLAGAELYSSKAYKAGELLWHGGADLELPVPEIIREDVAESMRQVAHILAAKQKGGR